MALPNQEFDPLPSNQDRQLTALQTDLERESRLVRFRWPLLFAAGALTVSAYFLGPDHTPSPKQPLPVTAVAPETTAQSHPVTDEDVCVTGFKQAIAYGVDRSQAAQDAQACENAQNMGQNLLDIGKNG